MSQEGIEKTPIAADKMSESQSLRVGSRVIVVGSASKKGQIRYLGDTQFSAGEWVGVVLDNPLGENNGTVDGVKYFEAGPKHGIFVRREDVKLENTTPGSQKLDALRRRKSSQTIGGSMASSKPTKDVSFVKKSADGTPDAKSRTSVSRNLLSRRGEDIFGIETLDQVEYHSDDDIEKTETPPIKAIAKLRKAESLYNMKTPNKLTSSPSTNEAALIDRLQSTIFKLTTRDREATELLQIKQEEIDELQSTNKLLLNKISELENTLIVSQELEVPVTKVLEAKINSEIDIELSTPIQNTNSENLEVFSTDYVKNLENQVKELQLTVEKLKKEKKTLAKDCAVFEERNYNLQNHLNSTKKQVDVLLQSPKVKKNMKSNPQLYESFTPLRRIHDYLQHKTGDSKENRLKTKVKDEVAWFW